MCVCVVVCVVVCVAVVWVCPVVGGRVRWGSCGRCVVSKNKNPTLRMWGKSQIPMRGTYRTVKFQRLLLEGSGEHI